MPQLYSPPTSKHQPLPPCVSTSSAIYSCWLPQTKHPSNSSKQFVFLLFHQSFDQYVVVFDIEIEDVRFVISEVIIEHNFEINWNYGSSVWKSRRSFSGQSSYIDAISGIPRAARCISTYKNI